jgi:glycosyltransferase involved in cell wall biosynthesis
VRIGIDARELSGRPTGVGRYLNGLLAEWAGDTGDRHEFLLYAHQALEALHPTARFVTRVVPGSGGTAWEQLDLPAALRADRPDVLFAPAYTAPLTARLPVVLAVHDVSFAAHPEWFSIREGIRRRLLTGRAAAMARTVTTLSEFSKREIVEHLQVPESKVRIIRPGVTSPMPRDRPPVASSAPRVLFVGSIFNRRHVPDLIGAFGQLLRAHDDVRLDIVGDNRTHPREDIVGLIARERLSDRITWHRFLPDDALSRLYASAHAFAFLSEYEGLGLTPLEALAAGVPSVLLDTPIARESCGPAALYVARNDRAGTTMALERLLFDEPTRRRLLDAAPRVLARYDWASAAHETLAAIEGAR